MTASDDLIDFLRHWEGVGGKPVLTAYQCSAGRWTIGYGFTSGVERGDTMTEAEAEDRLRAEVGHFARGVSRLVRVPLPQHRFDALVAFAYNVGLDEDDDTKAEGLGDSTLLRHVNAAEFDRALAQFPMWVYSGGERTRGLERRRIAEAAIFDRADYGMRP